MTAPMLVLRTEGELQRIVGYLKRKQRNPQAHGYRCSFHPRVFQSIDFSQGTRSVLIKVQDRPTVKVKVLLVGREDVYKGSLMDL